MTTTATMYKIIFTSSWSFSCIGAEHAQCTLHKILHSLTVIFLLVCLLSFFYIFMLYAYVRAFKVIYCYFRVAHEV